MPAIQELIGFLVIIAVIWLILKMARVAIRMIFFVIALLLVAGGLYYVFMR